MGDGRTARGAGCGGKRRGGGDDCLRLAPVPGTERVSWTTETAALGAYLRGEGGIHGGCAALDIGAGSIRAAIYLQNRTTPERSANIPYGTQLTLYETYANHPERIEYDFGGCSMGSLSLAKDALTAAFSVASDTQAHVGKTCMMLDLLLTENARATGDALERARKRRAGDILTERSGGISGGGAVRCGSADGGRAGGFDAESLSARVDAGSADGRRSCCL